MPKIFEKTIASFCIQFNSTLFPNALRDLDTDKIIQIGTVFSLYDTPGKNNKIIYKNLITLLDVDKSKLEHETNIETYYTEKELLLAWTQLIKRMDPDIITGYNICGFEFEYLKQRAQKHNIHFQFAKFNKYDEDFTKYVELQLGIIIKFYDMKDRKIIDMFKIIMKKYELDSYKLVKVEEYFLSKSVNYKPLDMTMLGRNVLTLYERTTLANFCIARCIVIINLFNLIITDELDKPYDHLYSTHN
jgi:DNA polymerase elongation subunit (family B)